MGKNIINFNMKKVKIHSLNSTLPPQVHLIVHSVSQSVIHNTKTIINSFRMKAIWRAKENVVSWKSEFATKTISTLAAAGMCCVWGNTRMEENQSEHARKFPSNSIAKMWEWRIKQAGVHLLFNKYSLVSPKWTRWNGENNSGGDGL